MVDLARHYPIGSRQASERAARRGATLQLWLRRRSTIAVLMCLPLIVIVAGLIIYPALYSIYLSMLNKAQTRFVGLGAVILY